MENKKSKILIVLLIILIAIMGICMYIQKTESDKQISNLENRATELIDISEKITLDGVYAIPDTDSGWEFLPNGKAAVLGNISMAEGIYRTVGENLIAVHYTKNTEWTENGEEIITDVDWYDYIYVDENNDIYWLNSNEMLVKLERFGEAVNLK